MPCRLDCSTIHKIIICKNGNILEKNIEISQIEIQKLNLNQLNINNYQKFVIVNFFSKNYVIFRTSISSDKFQFFQYYFEEWKPLKIFNKPFIESNQYKSNLKNINNYTHEEREIIFGLVFGHISNKDLFNFLSQWHFIKESSIDYVIRILYKKFSTNNRGELINYFRFYELDKYIPESIFPPGIYDINLNLICPIEVN